MEYCKGVTRKVLCSHRISRNTFSCLLENFEIITNTGVVTYKERDSSIVDVCNNKYIYLFMCRQTVIKIFIFYDEDINWMSNKEFINLMTAFVLTFAVYYLLH